MEFRNREFKIAATTEVDGVREAVVLTMRMAEEVGVLEVTRCETLEEQARRESQDV